MNSFGGRASVLWGLLIFAIVIGLWLGRSQESEPPIAIVEQAETRTIIVHVGGWVARPGLVELSEGRRVADAIAAAGGTLPGADTASINLAAPLTDGTQILVAGPGGTVAAAAEPDSSGLVHLNQATVEELDRLPGIGPVIAQRIVDFREENGPFASVDDLLAVPGIGEAKLASLRDLVAP